MVRGVSTRACPSARAASTTRLDPKRTRPEWGHGSWHGELAETRDSIDLATVDPADPTMVHVQQVCRATSGERSGVGVFEQLVIGSHAPSGFRGLALPIDESSSALETNNNAR